MAFDAKGLDDYIDVAQRIADFRQAYPEGTLQPADPAHPWEQAIVNGVAKDGKPYAVTMIVYTAAAYRTPDDPRPGIGVAWEVFPGRTPYTLGSELMNAETSAWGRAIIAVGASDSRRGIASREEVRNRRAERDDGLPVNADGSLSRSRTTDAEKDAAGNMTSAQWSEHTALQKGADGKLPAADRAKVQHVQETPPDDPFYDSGEPPAERDYDSPATISMGALKAIHAKYGVLGIKGRDLSLTTTRRLLDLQVLGSHSELSRNQGALLLSKLDEQETKA